MTLEDKLAELEQRRTAFKDFRESVEADLRRLREQRLATEQAAIVGLILEAAAAGATTGQIKRAYGTKDHRTIADIIRNHTAEIEALQRRTVDAVEELPDWLTLHEHYVTVREGEFEANFTWTDVGDEFMFVTEEPLCDPSYTIKNEAVALLDGKTESESERARLIAKFLSNNPSR